MKCSAELTINLSQAQPDNVKSLRSSLLFCVCLLVSPPICPGVKAAGFDTEAYVALRQVREQAMPYWYETAIDWKRGGYVLCDDAKSGRCTPDEKQIVTQARMIWGFSLAHRKSLSTSELDYLKAASHGVRFLRERMRDREQGGYYWSVGLDGQPKDTRKRLYGEAFVVYALVEYSRASGDRTALADALELFREIQKRAHDAKNGGWNEHFDRHWKPMVSKDPAAIVEVAGYKSANTHLHLMEAFTELYAETQDAEVRSALEESLRLNQQYFYPSDPARSAFHFQPDWKPVTDSSSAGLSYGHNVEFAWLMLRAEEVLRRPLSWSHFHHHLEHAIRYGTDPARGGTYNRGQGNQPATDRNKVWWVQAEMLAALSYGLQDRPNDPTYTQTLRQLWNWIIQHQMDPHSSIWIDTVTESGDIQSAGLAHNWKANYHDIRALMIFWEKMGR